MPTPKFANLQAILAEESEPETGVVAERAEERLEAEMRSVLIDFFERFFLWCALFRPVEGSRGTRRRPCASFSKTVGSGASSASATCSSARDWPCTAH